MKVLIALSGGVDSSLAAALLQEEGHQVMAVTLRQDGPGVDQGIEDARRVAAQLGVEHRVLDLREAFRREVVEPFADAYRRGLTPNPCIECNRRLRFPALLAEAARLGCDVAATGHHARVDRSAGRARLLRGIEEAKDQSYVLYRLGEAELTRLAFPVGHLTKAEVRRLARARGLANADARESQDLCFAGTFGYRAFLADLPGSGVPGDIVDMGGRVVGRHRGIESFTVGQRRGLGAAPGPPRYVVEIRPASATIVAGAREDLVATGCRIGELTWVAGPPPAGDEELKVKVRYRSPSTGARLEAADDGECVIRFTGPQVSVAPGQAAVLYRGEEVLGGGTILAALRP